jgi:penicillin G amidase
MTAVVRRPGQGRRRFLRVASILLGLLTAAVLGAGLWGRAQLLASLPQVEGSRTVRGLRDAVRVERDALGVPRIIGQNRLDLARATGFVHAQDRFFQMDLLRRRAAGELSELFGAVALDLDKKTRLHRFRHVAARELAAAPLTQQTMLEAYGAGVNEGLAALGASPFEYLLLRVAPQPWKAEDSLLVALAMYLDLQGEDAAAESSLGVLHDVLPEKLASFLAPPGTEWDAPVVGEALAPPPLPEASVFDLRQSEPIVLPKAASLRRADAPLLGSNNWAVAGSHTVHGGALLADDMHLGIRVPNTWYRASLQWPDASQPGQTHQVTGVTLPGTPGVIVGSNTFVAWGFTNTEGDWSDLVVLEPDPADQDAYLTPRGPRRFEHATETIAVKDAPAVTLDVVSTIWGPVLDHDHRGRARAHAWVPQEPGGVNLALLGLESARTLEEAMAVANVSGAPAQNFTCADRTGRIGWTVMGRIPRRLGFDGRLPTSWADGKRRWDGWLEPAEYPRIVDPPLGRIWTANNRVVDGPMLATMGDGGYDLGARAGQIKGDLLALDRASEKDMLKVQLDDRALFLARWRDLLLHVLDPKAAGLDARRAEARHLVEAWGGRASVESAGYRIVRAFRLEVARRILGALTAACKKADDRFDWGDQRQWEAPLWTLVTERPLHFLNPADATWDAALLAAADDTLAGLAQESGALAKRTWGERNTAAFHHPLSLAVPALGRFLDLPQDRLPGDSNMPRFQSPTAGASERMVVSPGREAEGLFHMPGGQSGHPLSPHYRDGHAAWVKGEPTPFLPGPALHVLTLAPAGS